MSFKWWAHKPTGNYQQMGKGMPPFYDVRVAKVQANQDNCPTWAFLAEVWFPKFKPKASALQFDTPRHCSCYGTLPTDSPVLKKWNKLGIFVQSPGIHRQLCPFTNNILDVKVSGMSLPVRKLVTPRPSLSQISETIRMWMSSCEKHHEAYRDPASSRMKKAARLIHVGDNDDWSIMFQTTQSSSL